MSDEHDTLPAPPPAPSLSAERIKAWGPVLTGIAALIAALATLQSGLVKAQTNLDPVLRDVAALRNELRVRDEENLRLRKRVGELEESETAARGERSWNRSEIVYLGTFHPPKP
jgi:hypothetical protein